MSLTPENELVLVRHLRDKCAAVAQCGYILPAPIFFKGKEDFTAQIGGLFGTQKQIETAQIALTVISYLRFEDLPDQEEEAIEVELSYNFYIFRQSTLERLDESVSPDDFLKRMLKSYHDFKAAIFNLREEFRSPQTIPALIETGDFAEAETTSLSGDDFVRENDICRYIPNVRGFSADLQGKINLIYQTC